MLSGNVLAHFSGKAVLINGKPQSLSSYNVEFIMSQGSTEYYAVRAVTGDDQPVTFATECKNNAVKKAALLDHRSVKELAKGLLCLETYIQGEPEVEFA